MPLRTEDTSETGGLAGDGAPRGQARVLRTMAFVDLSGFTSLTDRDGDDAAVRALQRFRTVVREEAAAHGVRIAKWLGDGAMLIAVEAAPLIEAVLAMQARLTAADGELPLRAGLTRGDVILFEGDDYIGADVNLAARLCDLAGPGQTLVPARMLADLELPTRGVPIGEITIKGLAEPITVVDLGQMPDR